MKLSKQEACRLIAEKLEPLPCGWVSDGPIYDKSRLGFWWKGNGYTQEPFNPLDDEYASATLLEAMPMPELRSLSGISWECAFPIGTFDARHRIWVTHKDRKTAIVLAALKWLSIECELDV